ncbi:hypothetical protein CIB48_g3204 [Xylaria polymorpha]|nr:hypothetical protein CIB48_g3204 [Xylaria polymorpha]
MRSLADASSRWQETLKHSSSLADLQRATKDNGSGSPCVLLNQTTHTANWAHALLESRGSRVTDEEQSPWNTYRQDQILRAEILQDVQRLPDEPFYHQPHIQTLITDVLFIYCKLNPDVGGYRQGMHELLAPIVYVIEQDAIDPGDVSPDASGDLRMVEMLDASFIEHDSFTLFSKVMDSAKAFYETGEPSDNSAGNAAFSIQSTKSSIVEKSEYIHEICLYKVDPELSVHLKNIEVLPQVFLIPYLYFDATQDKMGLRCRILTGSPRHCWGRRDNHKIHRTAPAFAKCVKASDTNKGPPNLRQKLAGARSPLSPPRFRPPPGGVEALFQGAAKNVLEQSEKLGINQAVRDAMVEIRRNVQEAKSSMKTGRDLFSEPRPSTAMRAVAGMDRRNRRLASMLDEPIAALGNLGATIEVDGEDKQKQAQDVLAVAVARLQFIKVHLEDSTLALPDDEDGPASPRSIPERRVDSEPLSDAVAAMALNTPMVLDSPNPSGGDGDGDETPKPTSSSPQTERDLSSNPDATAEKMDTDPLGVEASSTVQTLQRPQPPIPTRSTLAQSSFSWMLEPDVSSAASTSSASVFGSTASASKPDTHRKKSSANASRERTAFLFGEVPSDANGNAIREEDIFGLEPIRKGSR